MCNYAHNFNAPQINHTSHINLAQKLSYVFTGQFSHLFFKFYY